MIKLKRHLFALNGGSCVLFMATEGGERRMLGGGIDVKRGGDAQLRTIRKHEGQERHLLACGVRKLCAGRVVPRCTLTGAPGGLFSSLMVSKGLCFY